LNQTSKCYVDVKNNVNTKILQHKDVYQ